MIRVSVLILALLLGGCSMFGSSDQGTAGLSKWTVKFCPAGDGGHYLCELSVLDGKERSNVTLALDLAKKTFKYKSLDVAAFAGQAKRAEVEKMLIESGFKAGSDALGKMLRLLAPLP